MKILIDADACPVVKIVEVIAESYGIPVVILIDTNHVIKSDYSKVMIIGAGKDAVDMALINCCNAGDIVITQDYGLAAMALGKKAQVLHHNGWCYTNDNIDRLLMERHISQKARMAAKKSHLRGPKKRTKVDDDNFNKELKKLIENNF